MTLSSILSGNLVIVLKELPHKIDYCKDFFWKKKCDCHKFVFMILSSMLFYKAGWQPMKINACFPYNLVLHASKTKHLHIDFVSTCCVLDSWT